MEFGREKCATFKMKREKRETRKGILLQNQKRFKTLGEKETYKYLEANAIKQETKKNIYKRSFQMNEITSRNQPLRPKSHQRDKHLGSTSCKVL